MKYIFILLLLLGFVSGYSQKLDTSEVFFELNLAKVSTYASMTLDSLWFAKAVAPGKKTTLLGYGDYLGSDEYNIMLSGKRAKNVRDYLEALGLPENDVIECKGKGRIIRKPVPGQLGFYRDRKVMIITEHTNKKAVKPVAATPKPAPAPAPEKQETKKIAHPVAPAIAKKEDVKPVAAPKPQPAPAKKEEPVKPAPAKIHEPEVKRKAEKDLTTVDPRKLEVNDIIPLNNIFFAPGSNAMLRKSQPALDQLYKFMNDNKNIKIEIQGHICCLPPSDGADEPDGLGGFRSEGRAKNIYIFLVSKGIDRNRMKYVGLGNKVPTVYPEKNDADRDLNRRASIKIIGK